MNWNTSRVSGRQSSKQQRIYKWIHDTLQQPVYADVFRGATILLAEKSPGYVTFVAHAGREIMNGLVRTIREDKRTQVQYKDLIDKIAPEWLDQWGAPIGFSDSEEPSHHNIPRNVCVMIKSLIDDHEKGRVRNKETGEVFFSEFFDYSDRDKIPKNFVKQWKDTKDGFLKYAHIREKSPSVDVETEIAEHFQHLESFLHAAASSQYKRIREIDEILEETNG